MIEGQDHIRLWPYIRGNVPRGTSLALWQMIEAEGGMERLFYGQVPTPSAYSTIGDPAEFLALLHKPNTLPFLVQDQKTEAMVGLWWFDDVVPGFRASANIWMSRKSWGKPAREATRTAVEYGFNKLGFVSVWGFTPWPIAKEHAVACGFKEITTLPGYVCLDGRERDVFVLRRCRDG